jgi:predicted acetyltransferase
MQTLVETVADGLGSKQGLKKLEKIQQLESFLLHVDPSQIFFKFPNIFQRNKIDTDFNETFT